MAAATIAAIVVAIVVALIVSRGTQVKTVGAVATPTAAGPDQCGALPFRVGYLPPDLHLQSAASQPLAAGQTVAVAQDSGRRVDLARGVGDQAFSVSLFSHGPAPLQVVTVLGQQATLFPAGAGASGPRVPFRYPTTAGPSPCDRFQLEGVGISAPELQTVALGLVPAGAGHHGG